MIRRPLPFAILAIACAARADWIYTVVTPLDGPAARAYGIGPGTIVGSASRHMPQHATLWTSFDPASAIDVNPSSATESVMLATTGAQHVGYAVIGGIQRAGLWEGTSFVSLYPSSAYSSMVATGTDGTHQCGRGTTASGDRALLWSGSASSIQVLNPPDSVGAAAYAIGGGREAGWARLSSAPATQVAGFWEGTASSWTPLGVPAPFSGSAALAISPDGQTESGYVIDAASHDIAALWHGTPGSFSNLHPGGDYYDSCVLASDNQFQVGWTDETHIAQHAAVWSGSASTFFDLGHALPTLYSYSRAYGVYSTATDVWVAGLAYNRLFARTDAILWHEQIPAPGAIGPLLLLLAPVADRRRGTTHTGGTLR